MRDSKCSFGSEAFKDRDASATTQSSIPEFYRKTKVGQAISLQEGYPALRPHF